MWSRELYSKCCGLLKLVLPRTGLRCMKLMVHPFQEQCLGWGEGVDGDHTQKACRRHQELFGFALSVLQKNGTARTQ